MPILQFYRSDTSTYSAKYVAGKLRKAGRGITFFVGPRTTVAKIPATVVSIPYDCTDLSRDGLDVRIQGTIQALFTPEVVLNRRNLTVNPTTDTYLRPEEFDELQEDVRNAVRSVSRRAIANATLKENQSRAAELERDIFAKINEVKVTFTALGITIVSFTVSAVMPALPDLAKALQAEEREKVLAASDKAVADRRMDAARNDRALKLYEAETAMQQEQERANLLEARNKNIVTEATADAEAIGLRLAPNKNVDPRVLLALAINNISASGRVGQFNITSDFLAAIQGGTNSPAPSGL